MGCNYLSMPKPRLTTSTVINESPAIAYSMPSHGPLTRYVKLRVAHAPGMPGTFSPPPRVSVPDMHHGTCVRHVPWCIAGSVNRGFLLSWWWGKRSRHSWRMRNLQFYVSGKRPIRKWSIKWILYNFATQNDRGGQSYLLQHKDLCITLSIL